jgi:hypothetical protein
LDRERAATFNVAGTAIGANERMFNAIQNVLGTILDQIAKKHGISLDVWRAEATRRDSLYDQIQAVVKENAGVFDKLHAMQQEFSKWKMTVNEKLFAFLYGAIKDFMAGKDRYSVLKTEFASKLAEHKHRAIVEKMNEAAMRLQGLSDKHAEDMKLMAYQLDERNKLLVGVYGFVERREDVSPRFEDLAKICTSLGDAGGGWLTP